MPDLEKRVKELEFEVYWLGLYLFNTKSPADIDSQGSDIAKKMFDNLKAYEEANFPKKERFFSEWDNYDEYYDSF